jgi:hypothetical protein
VSLWEFAERKQDTIRAERAAPARSPHGALRGADELVPAANSISLFAAAVFRPDRHPRTTLTVEVFPAPIAAFKYVVAPLGIRLLETLCRWDRERLGIDSAN